MSILFINPKLIIIVQLTNNNKIKKNGGKAIDLLEDRMLKVKKLELIIKMRKKLII